MVLAFSVIFVFIVGASVGSFLNVVIARLPLEKSLIWPNSRCGACHQSIPWFDNLPLISYLWLRGRCRNCGQEYSIVYFLVELGSALGFVTLFWLELVQNIHDWPGHHPWSWQFGQIPWLSWLGFWWHALLFSFLLAASVCDLNGREIPLGLTLTGTFIGLIGAALMPWPWPHTNGVGTFGRLYEGIYPWPFWHPLPAWCGAGGNWETGLATGIIGALVGTFLVRSIGFVFNVGRGKEGIGMGDADLMMMVGAFLGWQVVVVSFFLSTIPGLFIGMMQYVVKNDGSLPYGPSLSISVMATCLAWQPIGDALRPALFSTDLIIASLIVGTFMLLFMSFTMRILRKPEEPEEPET
ncbi:MAG: prepilin peptidase [Planctomycetes bacterium]|nr:prepilin peptidase [Planctomycetota bacterium]